MSSREARDGSSAHQARTWAHMPTMAWASTSESKQSSSETGGQRLASPLAHAFREMLENAGADPGGFAAGVERDAQQVSMLRGKADQDFGLCLHDDVGVRLVLLQSLESTLQLGGGVFGRLPEQGELVLEIEVEGAGGVAGAGGDRLTRDLVGAVLGKQLAAGLEQALARHLGAGQPGCAAFSRGLPVGSGLRSRGFAGAHGL